MGIPIGLAQPFAASFGMARGIADALRHPILSMTHGRLHHVSILDLAHTGRHL